MLCIALCVVSSMMYCDIEGCEVCMTLSSQENYLLYGVGSGRLAEYRIYRVGDKTLPCGTLLLRSCHARPCQRHC